MSGGPSGALFAYDGAIVERFPAIRAGVVRANGLTNGPSPPGLLDEYGAEQEAVSERLGEIGIADLPSIAAWRRAFSAFGAKPTQHRNAAEALLRRLSKRGDVPSVSALVDIGNLVSIRRALPVAVFDLANVAVPITVRFATGDEPFTDLGSADAVRPEPGEVIFVDGDGIACARRWCWRQGARGVTGPDTADALFVVEGHHDEAERDVASAGADLAALLASHRPGVRIEPHALSPADPGTATGSGGTARA